MPGYNKTQLNVRDSIEKRKIYHRDYFAHHLRWSHVLKLLSKYRKKGKVLDVGCGSAELMQVLYRNRSAMGRYVGIDVRAKTIEKNKEAWEKLDWVDFYTKDILNEEFDEVEHDWDFITSFEVIEHIGKTNADKFLGAIAGFMSDHTTFLISTPVYDEQVGAAGNHTFDCGDGNGVIPQELGFDELKELLEKHFTIVRKHGTFASQKDIKPVLTPEEQAVYDGLSEYYDSNFLSVIFAPLHPENSRNCIWVLKKKDDN